MPDRWGACLLLAFSTGTVSAQVPVDSVVSRLRPGQVIRIRTVGQGRIEGPVAGVFRNPLRLQLPGPDAAIPAGAIDSLWVRGRSTKTGAFVGAAAGGVGSFAFWTRVCDVVSEGNGCQGWGIVSLLAGAGAIGGGMVGAAVGALIPRWRLRSVREIGVQLGVDPRRGVMVSLRF